MDDDGDYDDEYDDEDGGLFPEDKDGGDDYEFEKGQDDFDLMAGLDRASKPMKEIEKDDDEAEEEIDDLFA